MTNARKYLENLAEFEDIYIFMTVTLEVKVKLKNYHGLTMNIFAMTFIVAAFVKWRERNLSLSSISK